MVQAAERGADGKAELERYNKNDVRLGHQIYSSKVQRTVFRDYIGLANAAYNSNNANMDSDWTLSNLVEEVRRKVLNRTPPQIQQVVAATSAVTSSEKPAIIEELIVPAPQLAVLTVQPIQEDPQPQTDLQQLPIERGEEEKPATIPSPQTGESNLNKRPPETVTKPQTDLEDQQTRPAE